MARSVREFSSGLYHSNGGIELSTSPAYPEELEKWVNVLHGLPTESERLRLTPVASIDLDLPLDINALADIQEYEAIADVRRSAAFKNYITKFREAAAADHELGSDIFAAALEEALPALTSQIEDALPLAMQNQYRWAKRRRTIARITKHSSLPAGAVVAVTSHVTGHASDAMNIFSAMYSMGGPVVSEMLLGQINDRMRQARHAVHHRARIRGLHQTRK